MLKSFFSRASRTSYIIGFILCIVHLIISWAVIGDPFESPHDAQWQLIFIFFFPFDFPFSLFFLFGIFPSWIDDHSRAILVHGIIGPIWYFILPIMLSSFWKLKPSIVIKLINVAFISFILFLFYIFCSFFLDK
jgi:hypothetical protein